MPFKMLAYLHLLVFATQLWAQDLEVERIEITSSLIGSSFGGRREPNKTHVLIQKDNGRYLLSGQEIDPELVRALVAALTAPLNSKPTLENLGITPNWLQSNAASVASRLSGTMTNSGPAQLEALESEFTEPGEMEKLVPLMFGTWVVDAPRPLIVVEVTLEDGSVLRGVTGSESPYMLPWLIRGNATGNTGYNAEISSAVVALLPDKSINRELLAGQDLALKLGRIALQQIVHRFQLADVERKTGGTFNAIRSGYTIQSAHLTVQGDPRSHGERSIFLFLQASGLPANFSDNVTLEYVDGKVVGTEKFLRHAPRLEKLVSSIPWLKQYGVEHPKTPISLVFSEESFFGNTNWQAFSADMRFIGRYQVISKVEAMKNQIALVTIGFGTEESDWLIFPDQHMLLWRFWRIPQYGITSGLPPWPESEYSNNTCASPRNNFEHCAGREATPEGHLVPVD